MHFFPDTAAYGVSALGGASLGGGGTAWSNGAGSDNAFLESLNQELSAAGITPVADPADSHQPPLGFRRIKQDVSATLSSDDVSSIVGKLRKHGVDDAALAGIEELLASGATLTIGNIMGALRGDVRLNGDLSDNELRDIASALQKMAFSAEESDEITGMMLSGRGLDALRMIAERVARMGQNATALTAREAAALMRGLDLSDTGMQKVATLLGNDPSAEISADTLRRVLDPATDELTRRKTEQIKAAAEFKNVIDEILRERKNRERTEGVADTRGSRMTDRAEARIRDDLTAKANGFGPKTLKELEEEETLADERSAADQREESHRKSMTEQRTVTVLDTGLGKETARTAETSPNKEAFSPLLHKLDAAGLAAPSHNQTGVPQQNTTAAYANRQEIFSQVEQGMLRQLSDGTTRMTLQLNPAELGQLTLLLSVKGGEVRALIRTDNPETTAALSEQMAQLKATLEEQGLKVAQLDVETQLPQDTTKEQWSDMAQFNNEREMRERQRFQRLAKLRKESVPEARETQPHGEAESGSGLHIVA